MTLRDGVSIGRNVWMYAITRGSDGLTHQPEIVVGEGTQIGDNSHITVSSSLHVGRHVLMSRNVLITDTIHNYDDPNVPIIKQGIFSRPASIGDGCWLGDNAAVIGCHVGRNCVVSANAVVTKDVPDFCVVGGVPARILKRFDSQQQKWVRESASAVESVEAAGPVVLKDNSQLAPAG